MSPRGLDEDDVRIRPGKGKSRPRTKDRPTHSGAELGFVTGVSRGRYDVRIGDPDESSTESVVAVGAREVGKGAIVVGDSVALEHAPNSLSRIVRVEDRTTTLRRTADDTDDVERIIVANAQQLAVVVAVTNPEPRPRLIDRCLVAAYDARMSPLLVITKSDLAAPDNLLAAYPGVATCVLAREGAAQVGIEQLVAALAGKVSVLVGASGVGKSTLVNALVVDAARDTGVVNTVTGRGRHTSSSAVALQLPSGGWVIDTPGVRSFGLAHVDPRNVAAAFDDLDTSACPRGCTHLDESCALDAYVASGRAGPNGAARLDSLRRLLTALSE